MLKPRLTSTSSILVSVLCLSACNPYDAANSVTKAIETGKVIEVSSEAEKQKLADRQRFEKMHEDQVSARLAESKRQSEKLEEERLQSRLAGCNSSRVQRHTQFDVRMKSQDLDGAAALVSDCADITNDPEDKIRLVKTEVENLLNQANLAMKEYNWFGSKQLYDEINQKIFSSEFLGASLNLRKEYGKAISILEREIRKNQTSAASYAKNTPQNGSLTTEHTGKNWWVASFNKKMEFSTLVTKRLTAGAYSARDMYECLDEVYADPTGSPHSFSVELGASAALCDKAMRAMLRGAM